MARSSVQKLVKGDIIVERVNGKKRMTPVTKVEFNACSSKGVHVNRSMCYDFNAVVELEDQETILDDLEAEFDDGADIDAEIDRQGSTDAELEALAERVIRV